MSDAVEQTAELQEQLDFTAKLAQQKAEDDLKNARERWREQETEKTLAFQQEKFDFVAGPPRQYLGFKFVSDGVEVVTAEWTLVSAVTKISKDDVLQMVANLQEKVK